MSEPVNGTTRKASSVKKLRLLLKKSLTFPKFPSLLSLAAQDGDEVEKGSSSSRSRISEDDIDNELRQLQVHLHDLRQEITDIRQKNNADLEAMTAVIKHDMARLNQFAEQLDDFDQCVQFDKENILVQMEEMEAKIHHQITQQNSDLQEAIEGLYLRIDTLEKIYDEHQQQERIDVREASYARHIAVKIANFCLCVAQVFLVVVNTIAEAVRPVTSNVANLAIIFFILYLMAVLNDEQIGNVTHRLFKRTTPAGWTWK